MTSNGPVKVNETMRFEIDLGKLGTGTCMWVDLGDNSPLHVFGNQSCPGQINVDSINPNIVAVPRMMYTYKPPDTQYITISHVYARVASYNIRMNASNAISTVNHEMLGVVLPYVCKNPNVTIEGTNFLFEFLCLLTDYY